MSNASLPFSFDCLLQAPAPQSGYISSNHFVRNSGLYDINVFDAQLNSSFRDGHNVERITIRAYAVHKEHPEHAGRAVINIFVPNPGEQHASDYVYYSLCQVSGVVEMRTGPNGEQSLWPNWQEQRGTNYSGQDTTELLALKGKRLIVGMRPRTTQQGRTIMHVDAVFTSEGYSAREISQQMPASGYQPSDILSCSYAYEGKALEAVQRSGGASNATRGFTPQPPAQHATQGFAPQQPAQHAPQRAFAPSQEPQQGAQAFAPQSFAPQAPQYQSYSAQPKAQGFAPQAPQQQAQQVPQAPHAAQQQPAQQAPQQAFAKQQPAAQPNPYAQMQQNDSSNDTDPDSDPDKIPF